MSDVATLIDQYPRWDCEIVLAPLGSGTRRGTATFGGTLCRNGCLTISIRWADTSATESIYLDDPMEISVYVNDIADSTAYYGHLDGDSGHTARLALGTTRGVADRLTLTPTYRDAAFVAIHFTPITNQSK